MSRESHPVNCFFSMSKSVESSPENDTEVKEKRRYVHAQDGLLGRRIVGHVGGLRGMTTKESRIERRVYMVAAAAPVRKRRRRGRD